jgi:RNA polymerase sigma-70 factor (ECF subfamily)
MILAAQELSPQGESLYRSHVQSVSRWAERLAGPDLDVEDIVHEVFTIAYERLDGFRGESSLSTWLFGITDKVVRHRRRKDRWRRWLRGSADEAAGHLPTPAHDPLRVAESHQAAAQVYAILNTLAERDRQILILCELDELTAEEVGQLLGIAPGNARLRLHRARSRFARAHEKLAPSRAQGRPIHVLP